MSCSGGSCLWSLRYLSSTEARLPLRWVNYGKVNSARESQSRGTNWAPWKFRPFSLKFSHPLGIFAKFINIKVKIQSKILFVFFLQRPTGYVWSYYYLSFVLSLCCSAIECYHGISQRARLLNQNTSKP